MVRPQYRIPKREAQIEEEACNKILLVLGIFSIKLKRTNEAGYPDRLFILPNGRTFYIEFKRPNEEPRKKQAQIHERLKYFGHTVETHTTIDGAFEAVRRALEAATLYAQSGEVVARTRSRRTVP